MENAEQAKAKSATQTRPMGVVVDFPSASVCTPRSPAEHAALASSIYSRENEPPVGLLIGNDDVTEVRPIILPAMDRHISSQEGDIARPVPAERASAKLSGECATAAEVSNPSATGDASRATPRIEYVEPKRNWLSRWLSPDRSDKRDVNRTQTPGLVAHFWTGGPPKAQPVRDISASGLFVVTDERWFLGTQILMTLTKTSDEDPERGSTITVFATAVRWGEDGVGLEFVNKAVNADRKQPNSNSEGANGYQLKQFIEQFIETGGLKNPRKSKR